VSGTPASTTIADAAMAHERSAPTESPEEMDPVAGELLQAPTREPVSRTRENARTREKLTLLEETMPQALSRPDANMD